MPVSAAHRQKAWEIADTQWLNSNEKKKLQGMIAEALASEREIGIQEGLSRVINVMPSDFTSATNVS